MPATPHTLTTLGLAASSGAAELLTLGLGIDDSGVQLPPYVILTPSHPMLSGCKFFAITDSNTLINCLLPVGGTDGTVSGGATLGTLGVYPAIKGDASNNLVTWADHDDYFGLTDRSITVIARVKANASHIGGAVGARAVGTPTKGWQLLFSNFGAAETGWNFAVWSAGGFQEAQDGIGAATQAGKDVVVAGTYTHTTKQVAMYTRQPTDNAAVFRNNRTNDNVADPNAEDWDVRATTPIYWLALNASASFFNGDVAWVAVFNRALAASEIAAFSRDEEWPFLTGSPPQPEFGRGYGPPGMQHPVVWRRLRPQSPRFNTPPAASPSIAAGLQAYAPIFRGGPFSFGPFNRMVPNPVPNLSAMPAFPPVLAGPIQTPEFKGGPLRGPWQKRPTPGSQNPPQPVPPPAPFIQPANIYAPPFQGGPFNRGPWGPLHFIPTPVFRPTPPVVPTPAPSNRKLQFINREVGLPVTSRLRSHTEKVADILNSLIRRGELVQEDDKTWTLDVEAAGGAPGSGLTGTFNSGSFGTG